MGRYFHVCLLLAICWPTPCTTALAGDLHSPWGDDADVLSGAGPGAGTVAAPESPPASLLPQAPAPSPEAELDAVRAAAASPAATVLPPEKHAPPVVAPAPRSRPRPSPDCFRPGPSPAPLPTSLSIRAADSPY